MDENDRNRDLLNLIYNIHQNPRFINTLIKEYNNKFNLGIDNIFFYEMLLEYSDYWWYQIHRTIVRHPMDINTKIAIEDYCKREINRLNNNNKTDNIIIKDIPFYEAKEKEKQPYKIWTILERLKLLWEIGAILILIWMAIINHKWILSKIIQLLQNIL